MSETNAILNIKAKLIINKDCIYLVDNNNTQLRFNTLEELLNNIKYTEKSSGVVKQALYNKEDIKKNFIKYTIVDDLESLLAEYVVNNNGDAQYLEDKLHQYQIYLALYSNDNKISADYITKFIIDDNGKYVGIKIDKNINDKVINKLLDGDDINKYNKASNQLNEKHYGEEIDTSYMTKAVNEYLYYRYLASVNLYKKLYNKEVIWEINYN